MHSADEGDLGFGVVYLAGVWCVSVLERGCCRIILMLHAGDFCYNSGRGERLETMSTFCAEIWWPRVP